MKWLINFKTGTKLMLGFGLLTLLLIIVAGAGYYTIGSLRTVQQSMVDRDFYVLEKLLELQADQNLQRGRVLEMSLTTDKRQQQEIREEIEQRGVEVDSNLREIERLEHDNPQFMTKMSRLLKIREDYRNTRRMQFALMDEGKIDEARQLNHAEQSERYDAIRSITEELENIAKQQTTDAVQQASLQASRAMYLFLALAIVAVIAAVVMTTTLKRAIADPLGELASHAERIARGDVSMNVPMGHRQDEVGALTHSFSRMIQSLQAMADVADKMAAGDLRVKVHPQSEQDVLGRAFATMIANLQRLLAQTVEGINVLTSSAGEISASTTQLASSATEIAAAVAQTTTTVEEVRQTAQLASQKSKNVSDTAQQVAHTAQAGRKTTEDTIEGMNRIREQVESIADSMVRLSEQTQAIGQIIATVEDLAAQSNILAVNAAIEAAKAGEQGKGFGVVAQEVRSLAEQSRQATGQVRSILTDIQKATGAAVMATEQGSKAVETGMSRSGEAGQSIQTLAKGVAEAAQAATQIAASSQQQLVGMDQVASAIENVKQASAQNAASSRQLESSAHGLKDLGQKLKMLVEQYKL